MARGDGLYKAREKIAGKAYKLELLGDISISITFNGRDLTPYREDDASNLKDLRASPQQVGDVDAKQMTSMRLSKFKLNLQQLSAWGPVEIQM